MGRYALQESAQILPTNWNSNPVKVLSVASFRFFVAERRQHILTTFREFTHIYTFSMLHNYRPTYFTGCTYLCLSNVQIIIALQTFFRRATLTQSNLVGHYPTTGSIIGASGGNFHWCLDFDGRLLWNGKTYRLRTAFEPQFNGASFCCLSSRSTAYRLSDIFNNHFEL